MTSKNLALISGAACVAVLATYAWAANQDASEVKVEEAATETAVEESAEPVRLCIPIAEANEATASAADTSETSTEGNAEVAETEETPATEESSEATAEESSSENGATEAEVALPICDENGNPPALEGEAAPSEETTETSEEPTKAE